MLIAWMFEAFTPEHTLAAFRRVDDELSSLPGGSRFTNWWAPQVQALFETLPEEVTKGRIPKPVPEELKADLSRFVLLHELLHELTHGPPDGLAVTVGDSEGTLPDLAGGWRQAAEGGVGRADDVLRWFRGWRDGMFSDLTGMIADVQTVTGAADVEIAPGVRMRINPEALAELQRSSAPPTDPPAEQVGDYLSQRFSRGEELTGPDYLMIAAERLSDRPFAEDYKTMLWDAFPDEPKEHRTDAQIIANGPASEWEATAGLAMMMAVMMAIERNDDESLQELLVTGARMVGKFPRYLKALGKLPPSVP